MVIDESFIFASASVIFILLLFKTGKSVITTKIESRITNIRNKFDDIININEESAKLLKDYQALYQSAASSVQDILASATDEVTQLKAQAEQELELQLKNKTEHMLNKIHNNEAKLLSELRLKAVNLAISSSIAILNSSDKNKIQNKLTKEAINTLSFSFAKS